MRKFFKNNKVLQIISDWYKTFFFENPAYDNDFYHGHIEKVLNCSDPQFGFTQFMCTHCGKDSKYVSFSCKSKLCIRCGRVSGENFASKLKDKLHHDIPYRHLVVTIPPQYRLLFYRSRQDSEIFTYFFKAAWECVQKFVPLILGHEVECGCIMVLHTVGRNCEYKPHIHILLMGGGIDVKTGEWRTLPLKFAYKIMHRCWTEALVKYLYEWDKDGAHRHVIDEAVKEYGTFVCYIDTEEVPKKSADLIGYLSRYISKPHISNRRILRYDAASGEVEFTYNSHKTKRYEREKIDALKFIGRLLQQINPKFFQKTRYVGLHASKNRSRLNMLVAKAVGALDLEEIIEKEDKRIEDEKARAKTRLTYGELCELWWGKDPFSCSYCGHKMELVRVWEKGKGFTYSLFRNVLGQETGPPGAVPAFLH